MRRTRRAVAVAVVAVVAVGVGGAPRRRRDPRPEPTFQHGADRQAQLVDEPRRDEVPEERRAALAEDLREPPRVQLPHHERRVDVPGARYDDQLGEFTLPYESVRNAADPDALLLAFLQATYDTAADLARWDRAALERRP